MRGGTECGTPPKSKAHKMEGGGGGLHSSSRLMGPVSEDGDVKRRARVRAEKAVKVGVVNEWAWRYVGVANAWVGPRKYVDVQTQWSTDGNNKRFVFSFGCRTRRCSWSRVATEP